MVVHLFFEQSGIFKNAFKKFHFDSFDYDILNDFGETDFIIDLFLEIENAYSYKPSVFDSIKQDDLIFAFFPCDRFTRRMIFNFVRTGTNTKKFTDIEKLEQNIRYFSEMNFLYSLICKLVIVCLRNNLSLIIENPYHQDHILSQFWHLKPKMIDFDRSLHGDFFRKPTQYWFINCEPKLNVLPELPISSCRKTINETHNKVQRSLISSIYAEFFIKAFIL